MKHQVRVINTELRVIFSFIICLFVIRIIFNFWFDLVEELHELLEATFINWILSRLEKVGGGQFSVSARVALLNANSLSKILVIESLAVTEVIFEIVILRVTVTQLIPLDQEWILTFSIRQLSFAFRLLIVACLPTSPSISVPLLPHNVLTFIFWNCRIFTFFVNFLVAKIFLLALVRAWILVLVVTVFYRELRILVWVGSYFHFHLGVEVKRF